MFRSTNEQKDAFHMNAVLTPIRELWTKNPHFGNIVERHLWTKIPHEKLIVNLETSVGNIINFEARINSELTLTLIALHTKCTLTLI